MRFMLNKLYILLRSIYGYFLKWGYDLGLLSVPSLGEREQADVVVSLTSYGRRVKEGIVCYSIYSILRQTLQPKRIILWLAEDEWTEDTLPKKVAELKQYGVEIRFCENMRSYKKLLPTLQLLPDEDIITVMTMRSIRHFWFNSSIRNIWRTRKILLPVLRLLRNLISHTIYGKTPPAEQKGCRFFQPESEVYYIRRIA